MKYKCCNCGGIFPSNEAIDGFKDGFKEGFICPSCKANIKGVLIHNPKLRHRWLFTSTLTITVIGEVIWGHEFKQTLGVYWSLVGAVLVFLSGAWVYFVNRNNNEAFAMETKCINAEPEHSSKKGIVENPWE